MNVLVNTAAVRPPTLLLSWIPDRRGSVSVEFVLGSVLIALTLVAGMELYQVVSAQSTALRAAVTMVDYMSLEETPSGAFINDLATFSAHHEIGNDSMAAFVISAVRRFEATSTEPDPPAVVEWNWKTAVAQTTANPDPDAPTPEQFADSCGVLGPAGSEAPGLRADLDMQPGEMVVVVEVCIDLTGRAYITGGFLPDSVLPKHFYQHQVLPVRGHVMPAAPS